MNQGLTYIVWLGGSFMFKIFCVYFDYTVHDQV